MRGSNQLYSVTYVSSAVRRLTQRELQDLVAVCGENNRRAAITGMLLHKDGNFMQALEGEEPAVRLLYSRITRDSRHKRVFTLLEGPVSQRDFPTWSMGYRNLESPELTAVSNFAPFLNANLTVAEFSPDVSRARLLLLTFKATM